MPLHTVAGNGQLEALQLLIDHSADVNFRNNAGDTPLCKAIAAREDQMMGNRVDIVQRLLEHGADSNPCDHRHSSHGPAMAYMSHGRADAESLLEFMDSRRRPTSEILVIFLGQPTSAEVGDASPTFL